MAELCRVAEGKQLAGVCSGLEVAGKGSATAWRLLFLGTSLLSGVGVLVYIGMVVALPTVPTKKAALKKSGVEALPGTLSVEGVEANLERLTAMQKKGLITPDEYQQLRKKELGLG